MTLAPLQPTTCRICYYQITNNISLNEFYTRKFTNSDLLIKLNELYRIQYRFEDESSIGVAQKNVRRSLRMRHHSENIFGSIAYTCYIFKRSVWIGSGIKQAVFIAVSKNHLLIFIQLFKLFGTCV